MNPQYLKYYGETAAYIFQILLFLVKIASYKSSAAGTKEHHSIHSIVQASLSVFQTLRYRGRGGERHRQRSGRHSSHNDNIQVADRRPSLQDSSQVWNNHHNVRYLRQRGQKTHILTKSLNPK